jgi:asparagine synthase (glutamine-hydrolysing)
MCGIAGILNLTGERRTFGRGIQGMARSMQRRGPDDEGFLVGFKSAETARSFSGAISDRRTSNQHPPIDKADGLAADLFLAHRRLSIIDTSPKGHQPMVTHDGRYWIAFNGAIYNFAEIADELRRLGVVFVSQSDTEVLLYAYRQWGRDALDRLNGMFAFVIWDDVEKRLFCARDRIGIKPFYYTIQSGNFLFGSDIKSLIASGIYRPKVDLEGLYHAMSYGVAPRPMTAFKDVQALRQGHWLEIDCRGELTSAPYWQIPVGAQDQSMSKEDAVSLLQEKLGTAVKRRLLADVPVGTFMSGGIDSTTVSALAAGHQAGIKAFTLGYEELDAAFDEIPQARATAKWHPMEHIVRTIKATDALDHLSTMVRCYEEPYQTLAPNFLISQLAADQGVKVVLNGLGGDELFAGYGRYDWLQRWRRLRRLGPLTRLLPVLGRRFRTHARLARWDSADRVHAELMSIQDGSTKQALFSDPAVAGFNTVERLHELYVPNDMVFSDDIEAMSYMDVVHYIGNHHVYRIDQFTMHFSLEGRLPFLDHELVEAAFRMPSAHKIRDGVRKWPLREVARGLIHPSCLEMRKKGFSLPMGRWLTDGPLADLGKKKLRQLRQRGVFDGDEVRRTELEFESGGIDFRQLWQLIAVELWFEEFFDKAPSLNIH